MKTKLLILIVFIILLVFSYILYKSVNKSVNTTENIESSSTKGICYFDIDDTLTSSNSNNNNNELIKECLDNKFTVGIVTASNRTIDHVCAGDKPLYSWMPELLCKQFNKNGGKMYNSTSIVAGKRNFPHNYPFGQTQGVIKAFDMKHGRDSFYPHIPDKCVVLFDDQQHVINDVRNSNLETQCSNDSCYDGRKLDMSLVREKIEKMKKNGCE